MIKNKNILLTGGAGFIGTRLCSVLADNNKIFIYDNLSRNSISNTNLINNKNINLVKGDILDFLSLKKFVKKVNPDIIIHLAAIAGIDTVIKDPVKTMEVNMIGSYNILNAIKELSIITKLDRFINFSTSEVFGINAFRVDEKTPMNLQPVGEARWTYSISKLSAEYLVNSYNKKLNLKTVTIRPFNIYGPGQVGEGAIHHFVVRAIKNEDLIIHGEGDQIRSWCYIDDMIDGIILCLDKKEAIGETFNIGNPRGTITILGLAEKIIQLANSRSKIIHTSKNYVDVDLRIPNIDKAVRILNFKPKIDLTEGIKMTIEWYRNKLK